MNGRRDFKSEIKDGAIAGFGAGFFAKIAVGFKEGPIGGLLGGVAEKSISYTLQKIGFSKLCSEGLGFFSTALLDIGFLHNFGFGYPPDASIIRYTHEEDMGMHHLVFYTALMLSTVGISAYRSRRSAALFNNDVDADAPDYPDAAPLNPARKKNQ